MANAADTRVADDAPASVDPARARLRALIREQVAARRPRPIARRTVELLAESVLEPASGDPAYRVVDRLGEPRLREVEGAPAQPLTLAEVLSELETRHPALFEPPLPEPEPEAAPAEAPAASETASAQAAKLRDDATRYIELQSAKAKVLTRSLAARSSARGRTLAASAGAAYAALRASAAPGAKTTAPAVPTPVLAPQPVESIAPAPTRSPGGPTVPLGDRIRGHIGDRVARGRDAVGRVNDLLDGRWVLGAATAGAILLAAVVLVGTARDNADTVPARETLPRDTTTKDTATRDTVAKDTATKPEVAKGPPPTAAPQAEAAPPEAPGDAAAGQPPSGSPQPAPEAQASGSTPPPEEEGEMPAPAPAPGDASGPAEVVDTATLKIGGRVLRLFGVEWVRGGQAQDLTRYLAGRAVSCQRAPGSENYLCQVDGRDLSEVVLFNGGGRASPEAGPDLVAAEDHARTERLGVWKR